MELLWASAEQNQEATAGASPEAELIGAPKSTQTQSSNIEDDDSEKENDELIDAPEGADVNNNEVAEGAKGDGKTDPK